MAKLAGRYQILRELGRGGFGITYLAADHLRPGPPHCVVKQLKPQPPPPPALLPKIRQLFEQEAATLERLGKHPQIPQLLAHFEEQGNFYIVQEFISGQTLGMELEAVNTLNEKAVVKLLQAGLEVLSFVHRQGVIHRDIKPDNLIRRRDGSICLIDFGAVKAIAASAAPQTQRLPTTVAIGTAGYMPDEQRRGKPLPASDVYALGMVVIEALTGKAPTELDTDPTTGEVVWRKWVRIDDGIAEVLTQMVRYHYSLRYPNGSAVLVALQRAMQPQQQARPPQPHRSQRSQPQPVPSPPRTRRRVLQWAGYGVLTAAGAVAWGQQTRLGNLSPEAAVAPEPSPLLTPTPEPTSVEVAETEPAATSTVEGLEGFEFASAKVDDQGNVIETPRGQAQRFIETSLELGSGVRLLEMVLIPAGEFDMGSPPEEKGHDDDEGPQRRVTVPAFMMGKYAVTQAQYQAVMNDSPSNFEGDDLPVENVSWNDAVAFCDRLSNIAGRTYRLPSEAEWEYACRAGTTTPFYFGPTITTELANYNGEATPYGRRLGGRDNYRETTTAVGSFPANEFGLYDMHGNVWEWCQDTWHDSYEGAPTDGSAWVEGGNRDPRLLRGGSWSNSPRICRSAYRDFSYPAFRVLNFGFRVVCSVPRT